MIAKIRTFLNSKGVGGVAHYHVMLWCLAACVVLLTACLGAPPQNTESSTSSPDVATYEPPKKEIKTVRMGYALYGDDLGTVQRVEAEVNRLLEEQNSSLRLEYVFGTHPYDLKGFHDEEIRKAGNDLFDIAPSFWNLDDYAELAREGFLMDLTDFLPQFPDLLELNSREIWREGMVDGRNYWIPLTNFFDEEGSTFTFALHVERSVLDYLSAPPPQTIEEMLTILRDARARDLPYKILCSTSAPPWAFHRTYEEWPFYVDPDSLLVFYADGSMEPYIDSDIFQKDTTLLQELSAEGLIEWLPWGLDSMTDPQGHDVAVNVSGSKSYFLPLDTTVSALLAPEKPEIRLDKLAHGAFFVSPQCEDPYAALEMIDTIYANDKIVLTLMYGVEGEDWTFEDDGSLVQLADQPRVPRYEFRDFENLLPYAPDERRAQATDYRALQGYPFSGFRFYDQVYRNAGSSLPTLSKPIMDAVKQTYALRKGDVSMTFFEEVKKELDTSGFYKFCAEELARYEKYVTR